MRAIRCELLAVVPTPAAYPGWLRRWIIWLSLLLAACAPAGVAPTTQPGPIARQPSPQADPPTAASPVAPSSAPAVSPIAPSPTSAPSPSPILSPSPVPSPQVSPSPAVVAEVTFHWGPEMIIADADDILPILLGISHPGILDGYGNEQSITIRYDPRLITPDEIRDRLISAGHHVEH